MAMHRVTQNSPCTSTQLGRVMCASTAATQQAPATRNTGRVSNQSVRGSLSLLVYATMEAPLDTIVMRPGSTAAIRAVCGDEHATCYQHLNETTSNSSAWIAEQTSTTKASC